MRVLVALAVVIGVVAALMALGGNGWAELSASRRTCDQATFTNTSGEPLYVHYGPEGSRLPPLQVRPGESLGLAGVLVADITVTDSLGNELSPADARTRLVTECAYESPARDSSPGEPAHRWRDAGLAKTGR